MDIMRNSLIKKGDVGILLLILAAAAFLCVSAGWKKQGDWVYVTVNGNETVYSLKDDREISIGADNGTDAYNRIVIKDHAVYMESASCPDQICVRHKPASKDGETIICLPNQVFIEVASGKEKDIDN